MFFKRSKRKIKKYTEWYYGPQDGRCPGCGRRWESHPDGSSMLRHRDRCDYIRWVDEEDAKERVYEDGRYE